MALTGPMPQSQGVLAELFDLQLERLDESIDAAVDRLGRVLSQAGGVTTVLLCGTNGAQRVQTTRDCA